MTTATAPTRKPRTVRPPHGTARLEILINSARYTARFLPVDPGAGVSRLLQLRKIDGEVYHLSAHPHGCECTCPAFVFDHDGRDDRGCKHLAAARAVGLI